MVVMKTLTLSRSLGSTVASESEPRFRLSVGISFRSFPQPKHVPPFGHTYSTYNIIIPADHIAVFPDPPPFREGLAMRD